MSPPSRNANVAFKDLPPITVSAIFEGIDNIVLFAKENESYHGMLADQSNYCIEKDIRLGANGNILPRNAGIQVVPDRPEIPAANATAALWSHYRAVLEEHKFCMQRNEKSTSLAAAIFRKLSPELRDVVTDHQQNAGTILDALVAYARSGGGTRLIADRLLTQMYQSKFNPKVESYEKFSEKLGKIFKSLEDVGAKRDNNTKIEVLLRAVSQVGPIWETECHRLTNLPEVDRQYANISRQLENLYQKKLNDGTVAHSENNLRKSKRNNLDEEFAGTTLEQKEKSNCKFCKKLVFHSPAKCWKNPAVKSKGYSSKKVDNKRKSRGDQSISKVEIIDGIYFVKINGTKKRIFLQDPNEANKIEETVEQIYRVEEEIYPTQGFREMEISKKFPKRSFTPEIGKKKNIFNITRSHGRVNGQIKISDLNRIIMKYKNLKTILKYCYTDFLNLSLADYIYKKFIKQNIEELIFNVNKDGDNIDNNFIIDSGATSHYINDLGLLFNQRDINTLLKVANAQTIIASKKGCIKFINGKNIILLTDVYILKI